MKILIIALPRTGSTSLMNKLAKEKNLKPIFEPFHPVRPDYSLYDRSEENIVLKTIISHHNDNFELAKEFDEIILLSRKNFDEHLESHSYQTFFSIEKKYYCQNPYVYKKPPEYVIENCRTNIIKWNIELKTLSEKLNIPISYYEDLFDKNSKDRLRLKEFNNLI